MRIEMPANGWRPRPHQQRLWDYFNDPVTKKFDGTGKRAIEIAHRRWGKDEIALHVMGKASVTRPATYWHMLPQAEQARKAIWTAVNPHTGLRRIDEAFPHEWRANTQENEMFIRFKWGATWQVVGSDNFQSLVGTPPAGIVMSEWAKAHPGAWGYLSPILIENKGWALAITTPEGRNHAHAMFESWKKNPSYHAEIQTVEDSMRICLGAGFQPSVTLEDVELQRAEYRDLFGDDAGDALIEQEWFCSWSAAILGAYFGKPLDKAERDGRICGLDIVPGYPINTAWDIGIDDPMAIWVFQVGPGWLHIVDYIEGSNEGFDFYCDWLAERGYVPVKNHRGELVGTDWVPHDAKQREPGAPNGRTRIQTLFALGRNPKLVPDHKPMDRINAGRRLLSNANTYFDKERCSVGLNMLRSYRQEWDGKNRVFRKTAKHDFACFTGETNVLTRYGMHQIKDLPETGEVLTPCGWKQYRNLGMTRAHAPLVEVSFDDGLTVKCTPDHLFLTDSGWRSAQSLTSGILIRSSLTQSPSISMESFIAYGRVSGISQGGPVAFTERLGAWLSVQYRRAVTFITGTITRPTICLATWSAFRLQRIFLRLGIAARALSGHRICISAMPHEKVQALGINQRQAVFGISVTPRRLSPGRSGSASSVLANRVASLWKWLRAPRVTISASALSTVRPLRIASVRGLAERADVYDIEVPGVSCFSLANGAVVHNSHGSDAWGHLAVAVEFPKIPEKKKPFTGIEVKKMTVNDYLRQSRPERVWE